MAALLPLLGGGGAASAARRLRRPCGCGVLVVGSSVDAPLCCGGGSQCAAAAAPGADLVLLDPAGTGAEGWRPSCPCSWAVFSPAWWLRAGCGPFGCLRWGDVDLAGGQIWLAGAALAAGEEWVVVAFRCCWRGGFVEVGGPVEVLCVGVPVVTGASGESLPGSCRPAASASVGVVSPPWRRRRGAPCPPPSDLALRVKA